MSKKTKKGKASSGKAKKSIFAEFGLLSGSLLIGLIVLIILCLAVYIYMLQSPKKIVSVDDDADIFTRDQEDLLEELAEKIRKKNDINVVIITTRDKGRRYSNSDDDCEKFASDYYAKKAISTQFQDNSGICILVDLTLDYSGGRFFWLYTYGTAYYSISNDRAQSIFASHKSELQNEHYYEAIEGILHTVERTDFHGGGVKFMNGLIIFIPALIAFFITWGLTARKKLDKAPKSVQYMSNKEDINNQDIYKNQTVTVTYHSDSSSGGGGGHSGGGGGGHSGGGGGRF